MTMEYGNGILGGDSLEARPLGRALQLPPSFELTSGDEATVGQESGVTFEPDNIPRSFTVGERACSTSSAKENWSGYSSELSNPGLGAGLNKALMACGGLSEGSSASATPTNLANNPNSNICTDYNWPTEIEPESFNDYLLFDDMAISQDLAPLGFPQFENSTAFDMPSFMSESERCRSFLSLDAIDHGFGDTLASGQGFKSLESITDDVLPYEYPPPSKQPTGLTVLPDSSPYPLHTNQSMTLSALLLGKPGLEPIITTGIQKLRSRPPAASFINHNLPPPPRRSRDFICRAEGCGMSYHRRAELHRHTKTHSGNGPPHACRFTVCDRAGRNGFWRRDHWRQHLRQRHGVID